MLILLPEEVKELKLLLSQKIAAGNTYWIFPHILDKLRVREEEWHKMKVCNHQPGEYIGQKTACSLCGSHYLPGMGFSWSLKTQ